ncbi:MAG TPA: YjbQ family protein, partial [Methanothrix sp.]|nr:YjbQ family protein [Methanothrix sp.]
MIDITRQVNDAVRESGVAEGICLVYTLHTT